MSKKQSFQSVLFIVAIAGILWFGVRSGAAVLVQPCANDCQFGVIMKIPIAIRGVRFGLSSPEGTKSACYMISDGNWKIQCANAGKPVDIDTKLYSVDTFIVMVKGGKTTFRLGLGSDLHDFQVDRFDASWTPFVDSVALSKDPIHNRTNLEAIQRFLKSASLSYVEGGKRKDISLGKGIYLIKND